MFPHLLSTLVHLAPHSFTYRQLLAGTLDQNLGLSGLSFVLPYPCLVPGGTLPRLLSC